MFNVNTLHRASLSDTASNPPGIPPLTGRTLSRSSPSPSSDSIETIDENDLAHLLGTDDGWPAGRRGSDSFAANIRLDFMPSRTFDPRRGDPHRCASAAAFDSTSAFRLASRPRYALTGASLGSRQAHAASPSRSSLVRPASPAPSPSDDPPAEGGGVIFVDLDEAAHASYVIFKYGHSALKEHSLAALARDVKKETAQIADAPREWLRAQVNPGGRIDASVGIGLSAVILPLSVLAIKAGIEETQEARHKHKALSAERNGILQRLDGLSGTWKAPETAGVLARAQAIQTESLTAIEGALRHNTYDSGIGYSSLLSGGAIFTKVAEDSVIQAITLASVKSAALTSATTAVGIAGTLALGPLAAGAAVALGGYFVHQARMVGKGLAQDRALIAAVTGDQGVATCEAERRYHAFIDRKFDARARFAARFKRWNAGFLGGACLYATSASGKAALGVAALAGAGGVLATPAGVGVLLVLGVAGGISMGVCSWQFLKSHGKSKQQQNYRTQELALLGRRFDAVQTLQALASPRAERGRIACHLRMEAFRFLSQRDRIRQHFLQDGADALHKFRAWEARATDPAETRRATTQTRRRSRTVLAALAFAGTYLRERCTGASGAFARQRADHAYASRANHLTVTALARWLGLCDSPDTHTASVHEEKQRALLTTMLGQHRDFLLTKRLAGTALQPLLNEAEGQCDEVRETFAEARKEIDLDAGRLRDIGALLDNHADLTLDDVKTRFLTLQGVDTAPLADEIDSARLNTMLAEYLKNGLSDALTSARGILFDMHRRSFHLQHAFLNPATV